MSGELLKWCQPHWDSLRNAIQQKGMFEFVSKGGAAAASAMVEELKGENVDACGFDPLMRAWSMTIRSASNLAVRPQPPRIGYKELRIHCSTT